MIGDSVMKIALISCSKSKLNMECKARILYSPSILFTKARNHVESSFSIYYILSAKHGLLDPDKIIKPYDKSLFNLTNKERKDWANLVCKEIIEKHPNLKYVDIYAGKLYRVHLIKLLEKHGIKCNVPLQGLGIGQQLNFYKTEGF